VARQLWAGRLSGCCSRLRNREETYKLRRPTWTQYINGSFVILADVGSLHGLLFELVCVAAVFLVGRDSGSCPSLAIEYGGEDWRRAPPREGSQETLLADSGHRCRHRERETLWEIGLEERPAKRDPGLSGPVGWCLWILWCFGVT
jgi:hypothetical protein